MIRSSVIVSEPSMPSSVIVPFTENSIQNSPTVPFARSIASHSDVTPSIASTTSLRVSTTIVLGAVIGLLPVSFSLGAAHWLSLTAA
jgi:hypothetical protein